MPVCIAQDERKPAMRRSMRACNPDKDREYLMVPVVGFELTTYRLQGGCSTN